MTTTPTDWELVTDPTNEPTPPPLFPPSSDWKDEQQFSETTMSTFPERYHMSDVMSLEREYKGTDPVPQEVPLEADLIERVEEDPKEIGIATPVALPVLTPVATPVATQYITQSITPPPLSITMTPSPTSLQVFHPTVFEMKSSSIALGVLAMVVLVGVAVWRRSCRATLYV